MALSVVLMEHDFDDPNKYRDVVQVGVDKASEAVVIGVGAIPGAGPFLAPVAAVF